MFKPTRWKIVYCKVNKREEINNNNNYRKKLFFATFELLTLDIFHTQRFFPPQSECLKSQVFFVVVVIDIKISFLICMSWSSKENKCLKPANGNKKKSIKIVIISLKVKYKNSYIFLINKSRHSEWKKCCQMNNL